MNIKKLNLSVELRLIANLLGRGAEGNQIAELADDIDWSVFCQLVDLHGVAGHLGQSDPANLREIPDEVRTHLKERSRLQAGENLRKANKLTKILDRFDEQNIRSLSFKGPVLSHQLWSSLARRTFVDLDLLVDPRQWSEAVKALEKMGIRSSADMARMPDQLIHRLAHHACSFRGRDGLCLDLHWTFFAEPHFPRWSFEDAWERSTSVEILGCEIPCLDRETCAKFLFLHHGKHCWARLGWLLDLRQIMAKLSDARLREMLDWADERGHRKRFQVGMKLAVELFDESRQNSRSDPARSEELTTEFLSHVFFPIELRNGDAVIEHPHDDLKELLKFELLMQDRYKIRTAFQLLRWQAITPWASDFERMPLAKSFPWLAYVARFGRFFTRDLFS